MWVVGGWVSRTRVNDALAVYKSGSTTYCSIYTHIPLAYFSTAGYIILGNSMQVSFLKHTQTLFVFVLFGFQSQAQQYRQQRQRGRQQRMNDVGHVTWPFLLIDRHDRWQLSMYTAADVYI